MEPQVETQDVEQQAANNNLPDIFDLLSGAGLVGGVVGSFLGNAALTALPISFSLALQIANRRKLAVDLAQIQQTAMVQMTEQINHNQKVLLSQIQDLQTETKQSLTQQSQDVTKQFENLSEQLQETKKSLDEVRQDEQQLNQFAQSLESQQKQLEDVVSNLQKIENCSQLIRNNPDAIDAYYQRGLSHQKLGDKTGAIEDYTEALHLDPTYAKAYHSRGILLADLGNKKQAVEDLRLASKYYFEQGDIESYEQARNLAKEFYEVRHAPIDPQDTPNTEENMVEEADSQANLADMISVGHLFDDESDNSERATIL